MLDQQASKILVRIRAVQTDPVAAGPAAYEARPLSADAFRADIFAQYLARVWRSFAMRFLERDMATARTMAFLRAIRIQQKHFHESLRDELRCGLGPM